MGDIAIDVQHLSKKYIIGETLAPYKTFRESITRTLLASFHRLRISKQVVHRSKSDTLWALKDISFRVNHGEVIGIIGHNGAGKSTLLKILSQITEPTLGRAVVYGRVGSLLEVGTGFHPELTGRENIYLNGAILGMKRGEMNRNFDEIVDFAEIERFLDMPVKRYSTGMYLRLAFSVAAHLEPEILLVDEVLAVGDVDFQKKCLGKMGNVAKEGRTVLFVSHNMPAVQRLCQKAYLLKAGQIIASGDARTVVNTYYESVAVDDKIDSKDDVSDIPEGTVKFFGWKTGQNINGNAYSCYTTEPCTFKFKLAVRRTVTNANFGIALWTEDGTLVWAMRSLDNGMNYNYLDKGIYEVIFDVPNFPLKVGEYQILVSANDLTEGTLDAWHAQPKLRVLPKNETGLPPQWQGILNISGEFTLSYVSVIPSKDVEHL